MGFGRYGFNDAGEAIAPVADDVNAGFDFLSITLPSIADIAVRNNDGSGAEVWHTCHHICLELGLLAIFALVCKRIMLEIGAAVLNKCIVATFLILTQAIRKAFTTGIASGVEIMNKPLHISPSDRRNHSPLPPRPWHWQGRWPMVALPVPARFGDL
jgi:hypothetical protein